MFIEHERKYFLKIVSNGVIKKKIEDKFLSSIKSTSNPQLITLQYYMLHSPPVYENQSLGVCSVKLR